jgi:hypothetical protein
VNGHGRRLKASHGLAAAAILAAAAPVVATTTAGQTQSTVPTVEHFYLRFVGITSGSPNMKPGATITGHSEVFNRVGGRRVGRTSELCTETVASPLTLQCSITAILWGSNTFTVAGGLNPGTTPYRAALIGGTGRFAGAHGTLLAQTAKGAAEKWTITYTR